MSLMHFLMAHSYEMFAFTLIGGPAILGLALLRVSSRKPMRPPGGSRGRSSLKVTRRELETAGQPWLRTYDAHNRR